MISSVKDLVKYLETYLDPDDLILSSWWTKEDMDFSDTDIVLDDVDLETLWAHSVVRLESYVDDTISEVCDALFDIVLDELTPDA